MDSRASDYFAGNATMPILHNNYPRVGQLRLSELLGALSHALDLVEGQPAGHCVRCCWIGIHIGREIGLTESQISDLYYTLLLKDLGCSSNAARICQLYMTDDIGFKHDFKTVDTSLTQVLHFVVTHTGMNTGLADRFRTLANVVRNGGKYARELMETRCHRGADIARQMRFSEDVCGGIEFLDEHWDGSGMPTGARGKQIPVNAQIALLAQVIDVFQFGHGPDAAILEVEKRSGKWFDPDLVRAFESVSRRSRFWDRLRSPELEKAIFDLEPGQHSQIVTDDYLDDITLAFAQVVDSKSPYTGGHSERVTLYTDIIASEMGYSPEHRRWMRRAALLHDIGKLSVSNTILDKPGKLDDGEWKVMKSHSYHSEMILRRIRAFGDLATIAGAHHERLDGKGYPYGLKGDQICAETRILTVADIFDALTAERPYRGAMPIDKAQAIMEEMVGDAIDARCFTALSDGIQDRDDIAPLAASAA